MDQETVYVCPKCGGGLKVSFKSLSYGRKNSVEVLFGCVGKPNLSEECDFRITVDLPFSTEGEILWPSQNYH